MKEEYPLRVPMGSLIPKPKEVKPSASPTLSEEQLRDMVKQGGTMLQIVETMIKSHSLPYMIENGELKSSLPAVELHLKRFVTNDPRCLEIKDEVRILAKVPHEVLITGETGTGKETIARAMLGDRKGAFIPVNCAGLPRELIESELFGYVKGAFTGAEGQRQGMLESAKEGVIFLDEIGELPLDVQGKFLRAIQDKKIRRVGATTETDITCKVVCATNCNLKEMVKLGTFRKDLYARISKFEIHIPSLAERPNDIALILNSMKGGKEYTLALTSAGRRVEEIGVEFNVRSLERYVDRFAILGKLCYT